MRILLVEDDELLGSGVCEGLRLSGYIVDWVKESRPAEQALKNEQFDAVILDIGLPKIDGFELLQRIRNQGISIPVLILTARELLEDKIKGLDLGADDYLTKPFDLEELSARLRALERRSSGRASSTIYYKNISVDPIGHTVTIDGKPIIFPRREFDLLLKLLENKGRVLSREYLQQTLYGWESDIDSNAVEVHVYNLRKKLGMDFIKTVRGVGYMIMENENPTPHND
ncbi:MAG: response regulator [Gammaproteobacteria bacterium]|nr:response regulator [Gammaproteobacteria bacterium]